MSEEKLINHKFYCQQQKSAKTEMPKPDENILKFKNYNHSLKIPFVLYADFECMLQKIHMCQPSDETSYTKPYQKHVPTNFVYYIKYSNDNFQPPVTYSGANADRVFYERLKEDVLYIAREYYDNVTPMSSLTEIKKLQFKTEKNLSQLQRAFQ